MNDPQVVKLNYRLITEDPTVLFENACVDLMSNIQSSQ